MDKTLLKYKGIHVTLLLLSVLTIIQGAMIIIQAYYLADAISSLFGGDLFHTVIKKLIIFFMAFVIRQLLHFGKKNIAYEFAAKTSMGVRLSLVEKLFQLGPRFIKEEGSGQTVTLVMEGITKFRRYLELFLPKFVNMAFVPGMVCLFILSINIRSGIIIIITFPILIIFMILLGLAAKSKADSQYASHQLLSNHFVDSLRGLETLKYLGRSREHGEQIKKVSENYRKSTMATLRIAFLSSFALDFFTMLSVATVAVFLGLGLINGTIELHPALAILILAPEFFISIREVGMDYHATLDGKEAGSHIQGILEHKAKQANDVTVPKWECHTTFSVKGLSVHYEEGNVRGLQKVGFDVNGFRKIGIIGASGAGKSTLVDVLSGFLAPNSGEFTLNNQVLTSLTEERWQKQLTYIPQHPYIFHDTMRNNIRFYYQEATEDEVLIASKKAGLTELIYDLPKGLETVIGEGGRTLSGGQEQRIALARAYLGNRPIMMLDEPTAHLDIETEYEIKQTMLHLFQEKLVFFSTHRLHWMLEMDQIIVLDGGKIVEFGSHEELLQKQGYYYQHVNTQMGDI